MEIPQHRQDQRKEYAAEEPGSEIIQVGQGRGFFLRPGREIGVTVLASSCPGVDGLFAVGALLGHLGYSHTLL